MKQGCNITATVTAAVPLLQAAHLHLRSACIQGQNMWTLKSDAPPWRRRPSLHRRTRQSGGRPSGRTGPWRRLSTCPSRMPAATQGASHMSFLYRPVIKGTAMLAGFGCSHAWSPLHTAAPARDALWARGQRRMPTGSEADTQSANQCWQRMHMTCITTHGNCRPMSCWNQKTLVS